MATTQSDYDALLSAYNGGLIEVQFADGRRVKYATPEQMRQILAQMAAELGIARTPRGAFVPVRTSKGL